MFRLDSRPFYKRGSDAILGVSGLHITLGIMIVYWSSAARSSSIIAITWGLKLVSPDGRVFAGSMLIVVALLASVGTLFQLGRIRLLLFIPQQTLLAFMAGGGLYASWIGAYLDGTVIPTPHILADQIVFTFLFWIHWRAMLKRAREPNG